jgi:hypothetical protein
MTIIKNRTDNLRFSFPLISNLFVITYSQNINKLTMQNLNFHKAMYVNVLTRLIHLGQYEILFSLAKNVAICIAYRTPYLTFISPYLVIVASICSTFSGPSFFRTNFPIEITSRKSPLWSHTAFPMT